MHSENWALALSRGYLGIPPTADAIRDIQVNNPGGVVGFASGPPVWAMQCEEPGAMVVLVISLTGMDKVADKEPVFFPGLLRVSRVEKVRFSSQANFDNFFASYSAFPDVPTDLVEAVVFSESADLFDDTEEVEPSIATGPQDEIDASSRDFFCGLSAGLLQILEAGQFDDEVEKFFLALEDHTSNIPIEVHADALLEAFDPRAKNVDQAIWTALVLVLMETRGAHGFDRLDLIDRIENHITSLGEKSEGVETWLEVARDVVSARRDPTPLNDEGSLGQRASLAFLLAHEPGAIGYLEAGPRVSALVSLLALAYQGFARADVSFKRPVSRMDAVLTVAEALETGDVKEFLAEIGHLDSEMNERDVFSLNGTAIVQRERGVSPYRLMLRARALEAGMELLVDEKLGLLFVQTTGAHSLKIFIDEDPSSRRGQPVVRFWAPVVEMKAKKPNAGEVRKLLERSWETGCALGVHTFDDRQHLCAFVTQLTNTLDRDEFDAHVENIGRMATSM
jgi:hypothetical protein